MKQALNLPKKIYFKTGSAPVALRELSDIYHCNRALLITDPKLYLAGVAAPVVDQLRHQGIRVAEYFTIGETVSYEDLRGALPKLNEFQPDVILGVGGENALSAAKALLALYVDSELDLTAAADDSHLIPACDKAKLVLIAADCTSGAQTSPFAVLKDDEGEIRVLKSIYLLPELSITDADFTQWLTAEGIKNGALKVLSFAVRTYLDPNCTEFTNGLLVDAISLLLKDTKAAMHRNPAAREHLHNAAALVGAACGSVLDTVTTDLPNFPTNEERPTGDNDIRCANLAEQLGFHDCRAFLANCDALAML